MLSRRKSFVAKKINVLQYFPEHVAQKEHILKQRFLLHCSSTSNLRSLQLNRQLFMHYINRISETDLGPK